MVFLILVALCYLLSLLKVKRFKRKKTDYHIIYTVPKTNCKKTYAGCKNFWRSFRKRKSFCGHVNSEFMEKVDLENLTFKNNLRPVKWHR